MIGDVADVVDVGVHVWGDPLWKIEVACGVLMRGLFVCWICVGRRAFVQVGIVGTVADMGVDDWMGRLNGGRAVGERAMGKGGGSVV